MSQKHPISLSMIVKNEEHLLDECLKSIRPFVDEIVIVDTGSTDSTPSIAKRYADKFVVFTDCNDSEGRIIDFAMARNKSLELATHDWVLWIDGDDVVENAHMIPDILERNSEGPGSKMILFEYEYSHDELGNVLCSHFRERMVYPKSQFHWKNPVHEVLLPPPGATMYQVNGLKTVHKRVFSGKKIESGRNLRILQDFYKNNGESDVRQLYYLGLEYGNVGDVGNALRFHKRYIELSGWDDEKFMACIKIIEHYQSIGDYDTAIEWALKSISIKEGWGESYFALARNYYFKAQRGGPDEIRNWERCVNFSNMGLNCSPTRTVLFVNPLERTYDIHLYLNMAYSKLNRVPEALQSAQTALITRPNDESLKKNVQVYEEFLRNNGQLPATSQVPTPEPALVVVSRPEPPAPVYTLEEIFDVTDNPKDVVIYTGHGPWPWNPETISRDGIGGSETMAWEMSRHLVRLGHKVRVYGDCQGLEGTFLGVQFIHYDKFKNVETDVMIASRVSSVFDDEHGLKSKINLCWVHDVFCGDLTHARALRIDKFLTLSQWHKDFFLNYHKFVHPDQVLVTRNGISLDRFARSVSRDSHRAIYSSSPDRGLQSALDSWHLVRAQIPDAELHVYYGFDIWEASAKSRNDREHLEIIRHLKTRLEQTKSIGVVYHGKVGPDELSVEFLKSGVWAYPTWFSETSCISAMEAQAAGLRIVTSPIAALRETVGDRGEMVTGDWLSSDYQARWASKVVEAMNAPDSDGIRVRNMQYAHSHFSLKSLANDWSRMLSDIETEVQVNVLPKYRSALK